MTFVKNIDDPVIVDVFAAFTDFVSTGRTDRDIFGNRLVTFGAESHNFSIILVCLLVKCAQINCQAKIKQPEKSLLSFKRRSQAPGWITFEADYIKAKFKRMSFVSMQELINVLFLNFSVYYNNFSIICQV
jgi:hypothetical protein